MGIKTVSVVDMICKTIENMYSAKTIDELDEHYDGLLKHLDSIYDSNKNRIHLLGPTCAEKMKSVFPHFDPNNVCLDELIEKDIPLEECEKTACVECWNRPYSEVVGNA